MELEVIMSHVVHHVVGLYKQCPLENIPALSVVTPKTVMSRAISLVSCEVLIMPRVMP